MRLILASASPRRADLLRAAGFDFETIVADVDERAGPTESPAQYVQRLASEKSAAVLATLPPPRFAPRRAAPKPGEGGKGCAADAKDAPSRTAVEQAVRSAGEIVVIGADTAVVVDGAILGKPRDDDEAAAMLRRLSARRHDVMTGISVRTRSRERKAVESTAVYFAALSEDDVSWYIRSGEGRDKAGAYAIQGLAARFIPRIEGSYSNVVGLPLASIWELILQICRPGANNSAGG